MSGSPCPSPLGARSDSPGDRRALAGEAASPLGSRSGSPGRRRRLSFREDLQKRSQQLSWVSISAVRGPLPFSVQDEASAQAMMKAERETLRKTLLQKTELKDQLRQLRLQEAKTAWLQRREEREAIDSRRADEERKVAQSARDFYEVVADATFTPDLSPAALRSSSTSGRRSPSTGSRRSRRGSFALEEAKQGDGKSEGGAPAMRRPPGTLAVSESPK